MKVYIGVGSNIGNLKENLDKAVEMLKNEKNLTFIKSSPYIKTKAYGVEDQDDFLNAVFEIESELKPRELLSVIKNIEKKMGRKETFRWGPRLIDLDILIMEDVIYKDDVLTVPHEDMLNRDFVLEPLMILNPDLLHPLEKRKIGEIYKIKNKREH